MRDFGTSGFERARAVIRPLALVFGLMCAAAPARAQEPLTRADTAAVLVGAAERLQAEGAPDLAAAMARLVQRRYGDTPAATRAGALLSLVDVSRIDRSGRVELIAASTVYGAWLGVAIPLMLHSESPEAYGLGLILGAPAGFLGGRAYTRDRSLSAGDARAITFGATWGTWQGFGWARVLELGQDQNCGPDGFCSGDDDGFEETIGAMVAGGLIGITTGAIAANNLDIGAGSATLVNFGALWGTWYGVVAAVLTDVEDGDGVLTAALLGGDIGLAGMAVVAPRVDMSRNRARLINAAGVIGLAVGGGLDLLMGVQDEKIAILIPAFGSALGLYLGTHLTRDYDATPDMRQGRIAPDADDGLALVRLRDGDWSLDVPRAHPTLVRVGGAGERESGLALRVPLLDARF